MTKKLTIIFALLFIAIANNALAMTCLVNGQNIPCSQMPFWFWPLMILLLIVFLVFGILSFYKPFVEWSIKFQNKLQGTKTEITPAAIKYRQIAGIICIIISVFFLIQIYNIISSF